MNNNTPAPSPVLVSAKYVAAFKVIRVDYREAGDHTFVTLGDVSDLEIEAALAAEGADLAGWDCSLI
jgi:hypothetical protein